MPKVSGQKLLLSEGLWRNAPDLSKIVYIDDGQAGVMLYIYNGLYHYLQR